MAEQPQTYTFAYKAVGQRANCIDLFLPPTPSNSPLPAILYFHGGGLTVGNRKSWYPRWIYERAMQAGYVFISPDYTLLAPTSGHDLLGDIKDLFRYLDKDLNNEIQKSGLSGTVDSSSIIVSGSSAGGLCAYLAALHAVPKPKGVLSLYGEGGNFLSSQYLSVKTKPFFLGREMLDPDSFRKFLYPFPSDLQQTSDSPLAYNPSDHPAPGMPANLRMQLCRLYLQLGVYLDYYTGQHEPSLSAQLRTALDEHADLETRTKVLQVFVPEDHRHLFPELFIDATFPPTFLMHGELDSAVHSEESYNIAQLLTANGVKNSLRIANGEEHSFDYAEGAQLKHAALFDEAFAFIGDVLKNGSSWRN